MKRIASSGGRLPNRGGVPSAGASSGGGSVTKVLAALFLVVALWLAVLFGPQLGQWTWGPSLAALGMALIAAFPSVFRSNDRPSWWLFGSGMAVVTWFGLRAWFSPVGDFASADLQLLSGAVGGFLVVGVILEDRRAGRVLLWGIASLVAANAAVMGWQAVDADFSPGFVGRFSPPSGFFGHYNPASQFLIATSVMIGGVALLSDWLRVWERALLGVVSVGGVVGIYLSGSRGGVLGVAAALVALMAMAILFGMRRGRKWSVMLLLVSPLLAIAAITMLFFSWDHAQEARGQEVGAEKVVDNAIRLHLAGIAVSCVVDHPLEGGGSRSFSWECNRYWDMKNHGLGLHRPEQVHNEILQTACDYGLVGCGLLVVFVGSLMVGGVLENLFGGSDEGNPQDDVWRAAGLAGLAGILVQSNFSFEFHMIPGCLVLGASLAMAGCSRGARARGARRLVPVVSGVVAVLCAFSALLYGIRGSRVVAVRWLDSFAKQADRSDGHVFEAVGRALAIWPLGEFHLERAQASRRLAVAATDARRRRELLDSACKGYAAAAEAHPFNPLPVLNLATLHAHEGREREAMAEFEKAKRLQGGLEAGYLAISCMASYLASEGARHYHQGDIDGAIMRMGMAADLLEERKLHVSEWLIDRETTIFVHENLGVMYETKGELRDAYREFDLVSATPGGYSAHLRASRLLYQEADRQWRKMRKPGEALHLFEKALERYHRSNQVSVPGISAEQRKALLEVIQRSIATLKAGKVEPKEIKPFAD